MKINLPIGLALLLSLFTVSASCRTEKKEIARHTAANSPLPRETAILAGGCFWGMEEIIRKIPGVVETTVGYTGGKSEDPTYSDVKRGTTGHAESVQVIFDPKVLSYEQL